MVKSEGMNGAVYEFIIRNNNNTKTVIFKNKRALGFSLMEKLSARLVIIILSQDFFQLFQ